MVRLVSRIGVLSLALWALGPVALSVGRVEAHGGGGGHGFGGHGFGGHGFGGGMFHHPGAHNTFFAIPAWGFYDDTPYWAYGGYPGWGGWGWGPGWGYYYGGPFGGVGYSLYDVEMLKQQQYLLNASYYNVVNAQAAQAYQAANFYRQQAIATALANAQASAAPRQEPATDKPAARLDSVIDGSGRVTWPAVAPRNKARADVDSAIRVVLRESRRPSGATAASVAEARARLYAYGRPALAQVRHQRPAAGRAFRDFLNRLDAGLEVLANPPAGTGKGSA